MTTTHPAIPISPVHKKTINLFAADCVHLTDKEIENVLWTLIVNEGVLLSKLDRAR